MDRIASRLVWWQRLRLRLGAKLIGGGWLGALTRHVLIAQAARECITMDGQVILAKCQPLADALYADMPGQWSFSATKLPDSPASTDLVVAPL
jgi:hypothetical protein